MIEKRPWIAVVLVITGLLAVVVSVASTGKTRRAPGRWFYNLQAGELVALDTKEPEPITLPSGDKVVLAMVVTCGDCDDPDARQIAYLQRWPDNAHPYVGKDPATIPPNIVMDVVVSEPGEDLRWVYLNSETGMQLVSHAIEKIQSTCPDTFKQCLP